MWIYVRNNLDNTNILSLFLRYVATGQLASRTTLLEVEQCRYFENTWIILAEFILGTVEMYRLRRETCLVRGKLKKLKGKVNGDPF